MRDEEREGRKGPEGFSPPNPESKYLQESVVKFTEIL